jgi:uncharacterized LabA/DUF88 family protein
MMGPVRRFEIDSSLTRWMCFVDGENFTARGQQFAKQHNIALVEGDWFWRDAFLWIPESNPLSVILYEGQYGSYSRPVRSYYYTSVAGGSENVPAVTAKLWSIGFQPQVFPRKKKDQKAKGVDIALAKDFLSHAFLGNYDVAFLFAGDGDYVRLVDEVKRLGKIVCLVFYSESGLSPALRLSADFFLPLDTAFENIWRVYLGKIGAAAR